MKYFRRKTQLFGQSFFFTLLAVGLSLASPALTKAAPGDLDPTFGNGGIVVTPITNFPYYDEPRSMQVQPDGKIVVCGQIAEDFSDYYIVSFFLARYNPNGTLDASFGNNGKVVAPITFPTTSGNEIVGQDIALQPDGKIVTIGFKFNPGSSYDFAVNRYNSDGTLDASFGTGGKVVTQLGNSYEFPGRVVVQPNGKIVVAGFIDFGNSAGGGFAIVRYNPNGSLDTDFGTGGKVITPISNPLGVGKAIVQPDGKIVLVGGSGITNLFTLIRYNADGSLDSSFGTNGIVLHSIFGPASFYDGVLQPDGKIVAVGRSNSSAAIIRFNANGSIDTSFAVNGVFLTEDTFYPQFGIARQPDGKIVVLGFKATLNFNRFAVLRLDSSGAPDASFGKNGRIITPIGASNHSEAYAGAIQPDGKILAFGKTGAPDFSSDDIAIVRYLGDSAVSRPTKFDFDGDGKSDISVFRTADSVWYLNRSTQGFSATQFGLSTDKITPADYDGDGKTDIAVFRDGTWYLLRSTAGFTAVQFGLADDIPVPADYTGDGRAELAVYRGGFWFTLNLVNNQSDAVQFGNSTDKPVIGDYDGDGKSDYAVYRDGAWYLLRSTQGFAAILFGLPTDRLVPADYDGDGKTDVAVYRDGTWYLLQSSQGFTAFQFGNASDIPAPADYDGDGRTDAAVYRNGTWYIVQSSNGQFTTQQFGAGSDIPIAGIQ